MRHSDAASLPQWRDGSGWTDDLSATSVALRRGR